MEKSKIKNERSKIRARLTFTLCLLLASFCRAGNESQIPHLRSKAELPQYVPGEVIVKLRAPPEGPHPEAVPAGRIQALSQDTVGRRHQAILHRLQIEYWVHDGGPVLPLQIKNQKSRIKLLDTDRLAFYVLKTEGDVLALCAELRGDPEVELAQPNYIYRLCRVPDDPEFADQYAHQLIQMPDAWEVSTGSRDIVVAVLGTGVDVNHPDLKNNIWVNADEVPGNDLDDDGNGYVDDIHGWNFDGANNEVSPINDRSTYSNHETQVAGVIGGVGDNGIGVTGVNWQCSIMVLRLSSDFTSKEVAAALDYAAANGARVVNMSFGGSTFGPDGDQLVKTAIDHAFGAGVLLVASAGNSDTSRPHYPAAYSNVMAVASTNGEDSKTGHSTFGLWVDIAAPGTDIVTTDLDNEYIATAGTSFSAPYVAAVGALLLAHRPNLTNVQARAILENTTDPLQYEDLDPNQCYLGTGRVNAYQALLAADANYPLGEIVSPAPVQSFAADVNTVALRLFVHGDSYQLDYRLYGQADWTAAQGAGGTDPNGLVSLSLANPGVGTYELRLRVRRGERVHTDRKLFSIEFAPDQAPWPRPAEGDWNEEIEEIFIGSPVCLDVNGDGRNEIIQASYDLGAGWEAGRLNLWTEDGNSLPGWPKTLNSFFAPGKAVGDIDGDGDYEIVATSDYDNLVHAWHAETGEVVDGNWPTGVGSWSGYIVANPVLADLDGDGVSEVIVALDAESSSADGLYALRGDGTFLWQRRYTSQGPMSAADFDQDGDVEIALCGYGPGLSRIYTFLLDHNGQTLAKWRGGSPKGTAVADLNGDGKPELVFCTEQDVQAVRAGGGTLWKTRVPDLLDTAGALSIGDLDSDGHPEIFVSTLIEADEFSFTRIYGLDHEGEFLTDAGYPKTVMGNPTGIVPVIGDIDGDGQKELVVAASDEPLMAWEPDGSATPGFPMLGIGGGEESTPALEDMDQDGRLEMLFADSEYRFHVLSLPAPYDAGLIDWGMSRHDPQNSGWTLPAPRLDPIAAPAEIRPGERLQVQVTASNPANLPLRWAVSNLPEGAYYDAQNRTLFWKPTADQAFGTYLFSFLVTDGIRQNSRSVSVAVVPDAIYYADMDTDPDWQLDEGWAWGAPAGEGWWNGDPNTGHTGANVIGYALAGDYTNDLPETRYATAGPINCVGYGNIRLSFWRWLGVEAPYDFACVQVSNDGEYWTDLWTAGLSHVSDDTWQYVEYEVPAYVAEDRATVYFRWGLGPTDESIAYPGWNIDDVQVTGDLIEME